MTSPRVVFIAAALSFFQYPLCLVGELEQNDMINEHEARHLKVDRKAVPFQV